MNISSIHNGFLLTFGDSPMCLLHVPCCSHPSLPPVPSAPATTICCHFNLKFLELMYLLHKHLLFFFSASSTWYNLFKTNPCWLLMLIVQLFLLMNNIPLCGYTIVCLFIGWQSFRSFPVRGSIKLLGIFKYTSLYVYPFIFLR